MHHSLKSWIVKLTLLILGIGFKHSILSIKCRLKLPSVCNLVQTLKN